MLILCYRLPCRKMKKYLMELRRKETLRKFFEPELNEAMENTKRDIILNALKAGNSVVDISKVMLIPEKEIEAIAEANCSCNII